MENKTHPIITGTGLYISRHKVPNIDFLENTFLNADGIPLEKGNEETIQKFAEITGIEEHRYADDDELEEREIEEPLHRYTDDKPAFFGQY